MTRHRIVQLRVSNLRFDRQNPRLADFNVASTATDKEIIRILWDTMDVEEIVMSIAASGFFSHEALIVAEEHGNCVVIEGNRRLAAVKLLLDRRLATAISASAKVPSINDGLVKSLARLPAILQTREDAWRYLGFKHVNGPARWSSYAKSKYVANVHHNFDISLDSIAKQIGDTHKTVQRLYRGFMVIMQSEERRVFDRDDRWHRHFSFSHLYTGIQYPGISAFLGLRSETDETRNPVPISRLPELRELCRWMYGSKRDRVEPVIQKQNPDLKRLDAVVADEEALAALRNGTPLENAFELSRPTSRVFLETLVAAKQKLQKAQGLMSIGYDCSKEPIKIAGTVATIADDLYYEMERKRRRTDKRRYTLAD